MIRLFASLLLLGTLTLTGCIELIGQRLSVLHDPQTDTLHGLIFYDGLHNSDKQGTSDQRAREQLAQSLNGREMLLLDWFGHVKLDEWAEGMAESENQAVRKLAPMVRAIKVEPIGHYRLPNGQIGAAQSVAIPDATKLVAMLNAAINAQMLGEVDADDVEGEPTLKRFVEAARAGHTWATLERHALRIDLPLHRREWQARKHEVLAQVAEQLVQMKPEDDPAHREDLAGVRRAIAWLAASDVSLTETRDGIRIYIGVIDRPGHMLRMKIRENVSYKDNLAQTIIDNVPDDLHATLLKLIQTEKLEPGQARLLEMTPPAHIAWALFTATENDDWQPGVAARRLNQWAAKWNREQAFPKAPEDAAGREAWADWFNKMLYFPLEPGSDTVGSVEAAYGDGGGEEDAHDQPADDPFEELELEPVEN